MNDKPPEDFKNMEDIFKKILSQAFGNGQLRPGMIGVNIIVAGNLPPGFPFSGGTGPGHDAEHPTIEIVEWDDQVIATCEMRGLFDSLAREEIEHVRMEELSMGMSQDYWIAAREGATMVRVGSALFGARGPIATNK